MKTHGNRYFDLAFLSLMVLIACDRVPEKIKPQTTPAEIEEKIQFSMENLMDHMIQLSLKNVEEEQKSGHKNTIGFADGKWWSDADALTRAMYLRGVGDFAAAIVGIGWSLLIQAEKQEAAENTVKTIFREGGLIEASDKTEDYLANRNQVSNCRSFVRRP